MYSGYRITFHNAGSWNFDNDDTASVDSSSFHADNRMNDFVVLGEGTIFGIKGSCGSPEKNFSIDFSKVNTKFYLSLHYNANSYLFVNGKEILKFKGDNKNVNYPTQICLGSISNGFSATESREISLYGNAYNFSVDYNSIDKSDILNIHKFLMNKTNMK